MAPKANNDALTKLRLNRATQIQTRGDGENFIVRGRKYDLVDTGCSHFFSAAFHTYQETDQRSISTALPRATVCEYYELNLEGIK